ncbi:hypothetical protein [Plantactinospora sp. KBS50]|uniref:hypothetical protein n=1 Tax=Plantactinospora sp. KBS50 TaxID=2024580 RepID=UPI000BAB0F7C|nr:hypothetical protein [Plantactinospora sp. KBS50]ASW55247.1 hypothetical protein CIK06_15305 [Plantactinospora sp. KBS50]
MNTLILRRTGRTQWTLLDASGPAAGRLRAGRGLASAELTTAAGSWLAHTRDRRRRHVTAGPGGAPGVRLAPREAQLPGSAPVPARWTVRRTPARYVGVLDHPDGRITVRAPALFGGRVRVECTGTRSDLVVLAACFALLTRRHRDRMIMLVVAAATSHGPG